MAFQIVEIGEPILKTGYEITNTYKDFSTGKEIKYTKFFPKSKNKPTIKEMGKEIEKEFNEDEHLNNLQTFHCLLKHLYRN